MQQDNSHAAERFHEAYESTLRPAPGWGCVDEARGRLGTA